MSVYEVLVLAVFATKSEYVPITGDVPVTRLTVTGALCILYPVSGMSPVSVGAVHERLTFGYASVAVSDVGACGRFPTVMVVVADAVPVPTALIAETL